MKKPIPPLPPPTPAPIQRPLKIYKRPPKATIVASVLLVLFYALVLFAAPSHLPLFFQRLVGLVNAALAAAVAVFGVSELAKKHKKFHLFHRRKFDTGTTLGLAVFLLVFGWWFTPLAPIKVGALPFDEIGGWLGNELTVLVLVTPSENLTTFELPSLPPQAVAAGRRIRPDANRRAQALKALTDSRFDDAEQLANAAEEAGEIEPAEARILRGQVELFAGRFETAPAFFLRALELRPNDFSVLKQATAALAMAGKWEQALELGHRALAQAPADDLTARPICHNMLAALCTCLGRLDEAETFSQQAQVAWEQTATIGSPELDGHIAASRNNQAVLYTTQPAKYTGAESQFRGANDLWVQVYGAEHPHVASSLTSLGMLYFAQARFADAVGVLERALEVERKQLAANHPSVCVTENALAEAQAALAQFTVATRLANRVRDGVDRRLVAHVIGNLRTLGQIAADRGEYTNAAVHYRKALELMQGRIPEHHPFRAAVLENLAEADLRRSEFKETATFAAAALEVLSEKFGENHPQTARAHDTLGLVKLQQADRAGAAEQFQLARTILANSEQELGCQLPESARNWWALARLENKRNWREAAADCRKALAVEVAVFGAGAGEEPAADMPSSARYLRQLAQLYAQHGTTADDRRHSAALYAQALTICDSRLPEMHPEIADLLDGYSDLLLKLGQKKQAQTYQTRIKRIRARQAKDDA